MAVTHAQRKFIRELQQRQARRKYGAFAVEGATNLGELLTSGFAIDVVVAEAVALDAFRQNPSHAAALASLPVETVGPAEFARLSAQRSPSGLLAVARIPDFDAGEVARARRILYLDGINDPGNAGTLLRSAEWFGIDAVCASAGSVDWYNPKTVSAARGSLFRLPHLELPLDELLRLADFPPVMIAELDGTPSTRFAWPTRGVLVVGNESHGPGDIARGLLRSGDARVHAVTIPGAGRPTESLNAAVAGSVLLAGWG